MGTLFSALNTNMMDAFLGLKSPIDSKPQKICLVDSETDFLAMPVKGRVCQTRTKSNAKIFIDHSVVWNGKALYIIQEFMHLRHPT